MKDAIFGPIAIDALGEMMSISLGASATAMSNMLERRVSITTPKVEVLGHKDFSLGNIEPALGVQIKYERGLQGSNIMLLKRSDIRLIVGMLVSDENPGEEFELNELTLSAIGELMNQMMGAASTAMADFLGCRVIISTPGPFEIDDPESFQAEQLPQDKDGLVVIRFSIAIEDVLESEFMNVMSISLARELLAGLGVEEDAGTKPAKQSASLQASPSAKRAVQAGEREKLSREEIENLMQSMAVEGQAASVQADLQESELAHVSDVAPEVEEHVNQQPEQAPSYTEQTAQPDSGAAVANPPQGAYQPQPKLICAQPFEMQRVSASQVLGKEQAENLELIMGVPLQVTVEIGRTTRKVQDILQFAKGSLVVLDKLAGEQVDLFVNGKCIARGDVVVVEDNFGVRITEIVQKPTLEGITL